MQARACERFPNFGTLAAFRRKSENVMAFQPAPACCSVSMPYIDQSDGTFIGENVLHFKRDDDTAYTYSQLGQLLTDIQGWWYDNIRVITSTDCRQANIYARGLASEADVYDTLVTAVQGTQLNDRMPANVTLALAFKSGLTGRSANGRIYMCGMAETQVEGNKVTTAYAGALLDAWDGFPGAVSAHGNTHVVLSRWSNGVKRTNALPYPVVSYVLTDTRVDTRRARMHG